MILFEHEGKELLRSVGIPTPKSILVRSLDELKSCAWELFPCVAKAQVLSGKRGLRGGVMVVNNREELQEQAAHFFGARLGDDIVTTILVEERVVFDEEWYLSLTYSTHSRSPVLLFCKTGGVNVEDAALANEFAIHPVRGFEEYRVRNFFLSHGVGGKDLVPLIGLSSKLFSLFMREDARLLEINPLARVGAGSFVALDCKMMLDDDAAFRHRWTWDDRPLMGRFPTQRENAVRAIDTGEQYYRGSAGKYIELDGDIACLFSGGGASISMMDALLAAGGKPANYTEYSGNPPREKVYQLAKIVISKPGLKGIWIAGGVANFTHIGETMAGIADALRELHPSIPIVVRRAGPFEEAGKKCLEDTARELNLDLSWFGRETTMTETAKLLMDKILARQTVSV